MCDPAIVRRSSLLCALVLLISQEAVGQVVPEGSGDLAQRTVSSARLATRESVVPLETASLVSSAVRDGWAAFRRSAPGEWRAFVDRRTGRIESAEGAGLPWIPGWGNRLTLAEGGGGAVDLATLERIARGFLGKHAPLLGIDPADLVLDRGRS